MRRHHGLLTGTRPVAIWLLETALIALVLFLLWHPALSVATLKPQPEVHIRADEETRYESVGKVVATCQRAAILKIGFITEPPARVLAGG